MFTYLFLCASFLKLCFGNEEELRLRKNILAGGYSHLMRPVKHHYNTTQVKVAIVFRTIDNLNEKLQHLSTTAWARIYWNSEIHQWKPEEYGGLDEIFFTPKEIWTPDVVLYNSVEDIPLFSKIRTEISVTNDGTMKWATSLTMATRCRLDITYYPFDEQQCPFVFGIWTKHGDQVNISFPTNDYKADESKFLSSGAFNLETIEIKRENTTYVLNDKRLYFPTIEYLIHVQRRTKYYIKSLVAPSLLIGMLGVITFVLPAACGERIGYCVTLLLALLVLLLLVAEQIPETSDSTPIISRYLEMILGSLTAALTISCLTLKFLFHQNEDIEKIPWFIRVLTNRWLSVVVLLDTCNFNLKTHLCENVSQRTKETAAELEVTSNRVLLHHGISCREEEEVNKVELCGKEYIKAAKVWDRIFIVSYIVVMLATFLWVTLSVPSYITH